jgi:3',5'-nucleoside bisphosphate phosphatase
VVGVRIDLHCHSDASDGTEPPAEVMRRAAAAGLQVVALTDHDTVAGHETAGPAAVEHGVELVLGCEVSCRQGEVLIHLLAYLFDPQEPAFAAERAALRTDRERRAQAMVERLVELGVEIGYDEVAAVAGAGSVGRPHVARALVDRGVVPDVASAFTPEWIGTGGRAYVAKRALDPVRAVELVRGAGGVAVLAHGRAAKRGQVVSDDTVAAMAAAGLAGLEADHPDHDPKAREHVRGLARELDLAVTGASDDHGRLTGHRLGCETTAPEQWERLRAAAR